ncbi:hypothetical protein KSP39_PZI002956 [Platanthera zijinensis]|uniref:Uncharacterized protein n=1 Tax=Platanthera zijinensis TaxID=2320716 RepID=A0AAP0BYM5_9ASPA
MKEVMTTLLSNEARNKSGSKSGEGLFVKSSKPARGRSRDRGKKENRSRSKSMGNDNKDNKCHYYKEEGHWKINFPKRKLKGKDKEPQ